DGDRRSTKPIRMAMAAPSSSLFNPVNVHGSGRHSRSKQAAAVSKENPRPNAQASSSSWLNGQHRIGQQARNSGTRLHISRLAIRRQQASAHLSSIHQAETPAVQHLIAGSSCIVHHQPDPSSLPRSCTSCPSRPPAAVRTYPIDSNPNQQNPPMALIRKQRNRPAITQIAPALGDGSNLAASTGPMSQSSGRSRWAPVKAKL
ncbi:hypothetical protein ACLOJK_006847, partial [Asimina triloba]